MSSDEPCSSHQAPRSIYSPLDQNGYIRVLTLLPGSGTDQICCELRIQHLKDKDPLSEFVALSYSWGPKSNEQLEITIGDIPVLVQPNLYHALLRLRDFSKSQRFWIDAISINQGDIEEKAQQIPFMQQIYMFSSYTLIWLGESGNDSNYVMECIHHQKREDYKRIRFITGMSKILERSWFRRTWILQEFALSNVSPKIVCGTGKSVTWEQFSGAYSHDFTSLGSKEIMFLKSMVKLLPQQAAAIYFLDELRKSFHSNDQGQRVCGTYNLIRAFHAAMRCEVSDPRDKIYGVLGLVDQEEIKGIMVNYHKTTGQVFQDAMVCMLVSGRNPSIYARFPVAPLSVREKWSKSSREHDINPEQADFTAPSWVLNFNPEQSILTGSIEMFSFSSLPPPVTMPIQVNHQQLSVHGLFLGEVDDILEADYAFSTELGYDSSPGEEYLQYENIVTFILDLESLINALAGREYFSLAEPLWKTLLAVKSSKLTPSDENDYQQKWEMLMGFAKDYKALPKDDVVESIRLSTEENIARLGAMAGAVSGNPSSASMESFEEFLAFFSTHPELIHQINKNMATHRNTQPLFDSLRLILYDKRCFFVCSNGKYGICNPGVEKGCILVLLFPDMYMPFILRKNGEHFEMVGLAYIPSQMKEEAIITRAGQISEFKIV